jgi:Ni/Co efflux regulator RcnB
MRRLILAVSLASLMLTATAAMADDHGRGDRHHRYDDHDDDGDDDDDAGYYSERRHWHREYHRGERIEVVYLEPRYYVDDYEYYHLRQPPRGHRWIRDEEGRFILVAVASGIIADILLHH